MRTSLFAAFTFWAVLASLAGCSSSSSTSNKADTNADVSPLSLTGNVANGQVVFANNCVTCHGAAGVGGVTNPGSTDGTVPALNPIDPAMNSLTALEPEIESGSTPDGPSPQILMPAWGGVLTPQQIADVMAYILSLNVTD